MPRNIDSTMLTELTSNSVAPAILAQITFKSMTSYIWSGVGDLVYGGNTFKGVGNLGKIERIQEGTDVRAYGTQVVLSGIDPTLLSESLTDIKLGAPAKFWLALISYAGAIIGTPYLMFSGVVDKPTVTPGLKTVSIALAIETRLTNLSRASNRRYTAADQQLYYPGDSAFNWVEQLNDQALKWTP